MNNLETEKQQRIKEIVTALKDINYLSTTQYDSEAVLNFARIILEVNPNVTSQQVNSLMKNFLLGNEEFSPNKGVRNFTIPLRPIQRKRNQL